MDLFDRPALESPAAEPWMKRNFKPLVVLAAVLMALVLTVTRREQNRLTVGGPGAPALAAASGGDKSYDLTQLKVFNATLMHVNDSYVDPTRVDPKAMLLAALDQVQKSVAEVLVEPHPEQNKVVVRVDTQQKEFSIADVDSPWTLSLKMRDIFKFIQPNLQPATEVKDIEYAATNGMLSTLDPHSVLLEPAVYTEMKLSTRGQFGGLGIVIGIRKGQLTVIRPMPHTPASEAGIKAGDHIVRIEKESTVNMMLQDAVNRLRGEPGSKVELWVQRGDTAARRIELKRAEISVNTVSSHYLKNNIGYIKLAQFSGNSAEEMKKALEEWKTKGPLKGVILDLRGDPGGLLDQAIKVTDEFVDSGTIVTTVGYANKQRDEKRASPGNQPHVPMAVLINGGSASASEIVAGALKNLDRAVIIGSRSFGKGSVQVLYDNDDNSALKLTIAQYLTPGDVSIQSVGIVPDVAIEATALTKERISIFRPSHSLREQDLDAHLSSKYTHTGDKPVETVRYLSEQAAKKQQKALLRDDDKKEEAAPEEPADDDDDLDADADEHFKEDYEISFARDLLAQTPVGKWRRREVLQAAAPFFAKENGDEQKKIATALTQLGVSWQPGPDAVAIQPGKLEAKFQTDKPQNEVKAGDTINLSVAVTNKGTQPAYRVRAITKCDDPLLEDREFVFGAIAPGETRTWSVPVKIDRAALSRMDVVKLQVFDEKAKEPLAEGKLPLRVDGMARPRFAYAYQIIDDVKGNGDGVVEKGEQLRLHVTVKNVGDGKSFETLATLSNKSGEGVNVNKGRFNVDNLAPGESKAVDFTFEVTPDMPGDQVSLQMDVYDQVLHEYVTDKLTFPIAHANGQNGGPVAAQGAVTVTADNAEVHAGAAQTTPVIGHAKRGASFRVTAKLDNFYRVEIEPGRPAFLAMNAAQLTPSATPPSGSQATTTMFTPQLQVVPPRIELANPPLMVDASSFRLQGTASDEQQVADMFVFVTNRTAKIDHRKVFYRSNRKEKDPHVLRFDAQIPLWPGANTVTIVARQSSQVQSQQTLIVQGKEPPPVAHAENEQ